MNYPTNGAGNQTEQHLTQKATSLIIIFALVGQNLAFAADPVRQAQLTMSARMIQKLEQIVEKKAERFLLLSPSKQISILERAEHRYEKLISKVDKWSEEKFHKRVHLAEKILDASNSNTNESLESEINSRIPVSDPGNVLLLIEDERPFYQVNETETAPATPFTTSPSTSTVTTRTETKTEFLNRLNQNRISIQTLRLELSEQAQLNSGVSRKIASSTVTKALLTALFAILIVGGIFAIIFGYAITVATLGILAPVGLFLVVLGAVFILGSIVAIPIVWTKM